MKLSSVAALLTIGAALATACGGSSPMPAYADVLTEAEMTAVLTYIKSTWPQDIRTIQWEMTVRDDSS